MDKTITAKFDSVDAATFAARRVTSHFQGVKSVRVSYKGIHREDDMDGGGWLGLFAPLPLNGGTYTNSIANSIVPVEPIAASILAEDAVQHEPQPNHVTVRVTASEQDANAIGATLRFGGGIEVKQG